MKRSSKIALGVVASIGIGLAVVGAFAHSHGIGPRMMGGMGPRMMGGYGPGYGMGPGMMGPSYRRGPGGGYGPGYGIGPRMGGYGPGYGGLGQLNLTPEQWNKINTIYEESEEKGWEPAGRMREEAFKLRGLMAAEPRNRNAINTQYKKLQDLRQQRFQARLDVQEKIDGVLTKEQRSQLHRFGPW